MALTHPQFAARFVEKIARELQLNPPQVAATAELLQEGGTVPFVARYRKEATGSLDEVAIAAIRDRLRQLEALAERRKSIFKSLQERDLLSSNLKAQLEAAESLPQLEDLYAPHRPKRRTRATVAREKGLEPLAEFLLTYQSGGNLASEAAVYVNADRGVADENEALAGARDIIAERVSEQPQVRSHIRKFMETEGRLGSKVIAKKKQEPEASKYKDYFDWSGPLSSIPSHRLLAIRRGENEGFLRMRLEAPKDQCVRLAEDHFVNGSGPTADQVRQAVADGCERLLFPSLEKETCHAALERAEADAIRVFADNLRELLLASPLGQKRVLALDPGFRSGCKLVCLGAQGQLLHHDVLHLTGSRHQRAESIAKMRESIDEFSIEAIAIGNGTASRETEEFVRKMDLPDSITIVVVSESGASVYSASEVARREFPDQDVTVRGAISIGRRLMDPLAELVKIDPKAIGVGQYQHDVDQNLLKAGLDDCVERCVNEVGVEVNTASAELLGYVAGLNPGIARNIVAYRDEHGPFQSRTELRKVPRLGNKAYEQAAGFLRIRDGKNPLDASAVHPERYGVVKSMASDAGCKLDQLLKRKDLRQKIQSELTRYVSDEVGLPTLQDILEELSKPGRDPRKQFETVAFARHVQSPADLSVGMKLPGIVTNVTQFGAFVDIGVHQDGLVHISQLADHFVEDPAEVVKVNQKVAVTVTEIDLTRNRISLSLKANPELTTKPNGQAPNPSRQKPNRSRPQPHGSPGKRQTSPASSPLQQDWFSQALSQEKR